MPRKSRFRPLLIVARHFGYPIYVAIDLPARITDDPTAEATRWDERDLTWLKLARFTAETGYPFCFEDLDGNILLPAATPEQVAQINHLLAAADEARQRLTGASDTPRRS